MLFIVTVGLTDVDRYWNKKDGALRNVSTRDLSEVSRTLLLFCFIGNKEIKRRIAPALKEPP